MAATQEDPGQTSKLGHPCIVSAGKCLATASSLVCLKSLDLDIRPPLLTYLLLSTLGLL